MYRRAAGYFSSSALITWAEALPRLSAPVDVLIKLIISPQLSKDDVDALQNATNPAEKLKLCQIISDQMVLDAIEFAKDPANPNKKTLRLKLFTWMIANGRLEIRFAFPKHIDDAGIFHEKIGVFDFPDGSKIAFTGSANETISGHSRNYESIDVYRSWIAADRDRVNIKIQQFEEAWNGTAFGLDSVPLSANALAHVSILAPSSVPLPNNEAKIPEMPPPTDNRWRHQDEAKTLFIEHKHGVLEMATGTGKTRTAINIMTALLSNGDIDGAIISTDGTDLLDQWRKEIERWNLNGATCFRISRHFGSYHEMTDFMLNPSGAIIIISRGALKKLLLGLPESKRSHLLIIHDEVHGLGSTDNRTSLLNEHHSFGYRLGLSATPEREYDEAGTAFIENEVGPVIYKFGLKEAIERGILCEFDYIPLCYELTDEDKSRLQGVYQKKAARQHEGKPMSDEEVWRDIAMIYKTAEAKPFIFQKYLNENPSILKSAILFVATVEYGNRILPMIHNHTHLYRTYYGDDERYNLVEFANERIDCLLTCHRISQGIDIKNLKNVVLLSSDRSKLETIQRIGRCLRFNPNDPEKRATVIDFIRPQDPEVSVQNADQKRSEWLSEIAKTRRKQ